MAQATAEASMAPCNVYEGNGELSVATPVPGAHPQHTEVIVAPREIRILASCKYPQETQHYHRRDWQVGAWRASVALPKTVDPQRARATLNHGVLVVMAPIASDAGGEAKIPVR